MNCKVNKNINNENIWEYIEAEKAYIKENINKKQKEIMEGIYLLINVLQKPYER